MFDNVADLELEAMRSSMFDLFAEGIDDLSADELDQLDALLDQAIEKQAHRGIRPADGYEDSSLWEINKRRRALGKPEIG